MFRTSGQFVNLLENKSVLIGRKTMYQLASEINNYGITKICMTVLPRNVHEDNSNSHCKHLGLLQFREGSIF